MDEQGQSRIKKFFCSVTPFSKYLAMVLFVLMPFVGLGIGLKIKDESVRIVEVEKIVEVERVVEHAPPSLDDLPYCGNGDELFAVPSEDTSEWQTLSGYGFDLRAPSGLELVDALSEDEDIRRYNLIGLDEPITISIQSYELEKVPLEAHHFNSLSYIYELNSETHWLKSRRKPAHQCRPNEQHLTSAGHPVVKRPWASYEEAIFSYFIVLRPTDEEYVAYDCNRPIGVDVTISYDFDLVKPPAVLEQILQTIDIRAICKG